MTWDGRERRSSLTIAGPWGLRMAFVGTFWAGVWLIVGMVIGGFAGLGACVWMGR